MAMLMPVFGSEMHKIDYYFYMALHLLQSWEATSCCCVKINSLRLENFLTVMEQGYSKHGNPYHNLVHAADVTQTTHAIITDSGLNVSGTCLWITSLH